MKSLVLVLGILLLVPVVSAAPQASIEIVSSRYVIQGNDLNYILHLSDFSTEDNPVGLNIRTLVTKADGSYESTTDRSIVITGDAPLGQVVSTKGLSAGDYGLVITAKTVNGAFVIAISSFTITEPFYNSIWFAIVVGVVGGSMLFLLIYHLRKHSRRKLFAFRGMH